MANDPYASLDNSDKLDVSGFQPRARPRPETPTREEVKEVGREAGFVQQSQPLTILSPRRKAPDMMMSRTMRVLIPDWNKLVQECEDAGIPIWEGFNRRMRGPAPE